MRKLGTVMIIAAFLLAIALWPHMPDQMASHWNTQGEVDGYMTKFWGLFLFPIIMLAIYLLFLAIPKIDPLKKNIKKFDNYYQGFVLIFLLFFLYVYALMLLENLGFPISMNQAMAAAIAVVFFVIGILLKHAEQNWFIGIRTPWTLSSKKVWRKTHDLGSKLFKMSGVVALGGILFPLQSVWFIAAPVLLSVAITVIYSYVIYKK